MRTVYLHPDRCSVDWAAPTPVAVRGLLAELIAYLEDASSTPAGGRAPRVCSSTCSSHCV
jgi:hypothetical protein